MDIRDDTLELATWTVTADVDLSSATAEAYLDGSWHSLTWAAAATQNGSTWTRRAQILAAGPDAVGGVEIAFPGDSAPLVKITAGGEVIVRKSSFRFDDKRTTT